MYSTTNNFVGRGGFGRGRGRGGRGRGRGGRRGEEKTQWYGTEENSRKCNGIFIRIVFLGFP